MEAQLSALASSAEPRPFAEPAKPQPAPSANGPAQVEAPSAHVADLSDEEAADVLRQKIDNKYASLERRFSQEPREDGGSASAEQSIRQRVEGIQGYELSKVECRYTMCRLEIKADGASAPDVLARFRFVEGGEIRRRQDGSFLVFAGRDGFPFQEVNQAD